MRITEVIVLFVVWLHLPQVNGFYAQPEAIIFTLMPSDVVTCVGCGLVELTCGIKRQYTAADLPLPELQWMYNGSNVSPDMVVEHSSDSSFIWSTLRLTTHTSSHSGLYRCAATDGDKNCRSALVPCVPTVTLSNEARVQILGETGVVKVIRQSDCSSSLLTCGSTMHDIGGGVVQWLKDGLELLQTSEGVLVLPSGDLVLSNHGDSETEVNGLYECVVSVGNGSGGSTNITAEWYRVERSNGTEHHVSITPSRIAYTESETASLVCAYDIPTDVCDDIAITWNYENTIVSSIINNILTIPSLSLSDSGNYCCSVSINNTELFQTCTQINVYSRPDLAELEDNSNTVFLSSLNNGIELTSPLTTHSLIVWYHNGILVHDQNGRSLLVQTNESVEELYGVYQWFLALPGYTEVIGTSTRVMPPDRVNPPGSLVYTDVVRANSNLAVAPIQLSWQPPVYIGNLTTIHYQLYDISSLSMISTLNEATSVVVFVPKFLTFKFTLAVVESSDSSVIISERSNYVEQRANSACSSQRKVLYPPDVSLTCDSGWVDVSISDSLLNNDITRNPAIIYYLRGSCVFSDNITTINQKLVEVSPAQVRLSFFPSGTHCSLEVAATSGDHSLISCTNECFCYDPEVIGYSLPSVCSVSGTMNVSFVEDRYSVSEESSVRVCVALQTMEALETNVLINIDTMNGTAIESADFEGIHLTYSLNNQDPTCFNIGLLDDRVLENTEFFFVSLSVDDSRVKIIDGVNRTVEILDNDFVSVSLTPSHSVSEGDLTTELCVKVEGDLEKTIFVSINSFSGTATEDVDFEGIHLTYSLNDQATNCFNIGLLDDRVLENTEFFFVSLSVDDPRVKVIDGVNRTVEILDNDYVNVSLTPSHSVSEGDLTTELCVEVEGDLEKIIFVSIDSLSGTATEGRDYIGLHNQLNLTGEFTQCVDVTIVDDQLLEDAENFSVSLSSSDINVNIIGRVVEINITDNDFVNVSLTPSHSVSEGDLTTELCVEVEGDLEKTIFVSIDSFSGTATEGADFEGIHSTYSLNNQATICFNIGLLDDRVLENTEFFFVSLSVDDPRVKIIDGVNRTVEILDNDYVSVSLTPSHSVSEGDLTTELCVEVEGDLEKIIFVSIDSLSGTATEGRDYIGLHNQLNLTGEIRQCVDVTIVDDQLLEDAENFSVSLSSSDINVNIIGRVVDISITDNDFVNVSLTPSHSVSEGDLTTELCVEVEGDLEKTIFVSIDSFSGTATEGADFEGIHSTYSLNNQATICFNIGLLDDRVLENTEFFFVSLSVDDPRVKVIDGVNRTVEILDNDYVSVSLTPNHSVSEGDLTTELCVEVEENLEKTIFVSMDSFSGTATEGRDYIGLHNQLNLTGEIRQCVDVTIVDDQLLEDAENFSVSLSSSDINVNIIGRVVEINITDNDFVSVSLTPSHSVSEGDLTTELCVEVEGDLEKIIFVSIDSFSGTATEDRDFTGVHSNLKFDPDFKTRCINISIKDDYDSEGTEYFNVTVTSGDPAVMIVRGRVEIGIHDNEPLLNVAEIASVAIVCAFAVFIVVAVLVIACMTVYYYNCQRRNSSPKAWQTKVDKKLEEKFRVTEAVDPDVDPEIPAYPPPTGLEDQASLHEQYDPRAHWPSIAISTDLGRHKLNAPDSCEQPSHSSTSREVLSTSRSDLPTSMFKESLEKHTEDFMEIQTMPVVLRGYRSVIDSSGFSENSYVYPDDLTGSNKHAMSNEVIS